MRSSKQMNPLVGSWNNSIKLDTNKEINVKLAFEKSWKEAEAKNRARSAKKKKKAEKTNTTSPMNIMIKTPTYQYEKENKDKNRSVLTATSSNNKGAGSNQEIAICGSNASFDPLVTISPRMGVSVNPYANLHKSIVQSIAKSESKSSKRRKSMQVNSNNLPDARMSTLELPAQLGTKSTINETQGKRNGALLRIWTDSGPFSRVDAMALAASVLQSKLTEEFLNSKLSQEKQESFDKFCHDLNILLNIPSDFKDIPQIHFIKIWHLYGIYTSSMLNEKCVETIFNCDGPLKMSPTDGHQTESHRLRRVSIDADGVYAYFNLTTDNATQLLSSMNPALSECLSNPLQGFLVVYWRFVDIGTCSRSKYLRENPLNDYINELLKQFTFPRTSNKYITVKNNTDKDFNNSASSMCNSVFASIDRAPAKARTSNANYYGITNATLVETKRAQTKTICLDGCRYDVVRRIALESGFKEVNENDVWNIIWTDVPLSLDRGLEMRRLQDANYVFTNGSPPLQKANHFPGMNEICRKDRLARNLNRMKNKFGEDYEFFPKTWCLPSDLPQLMAYARSISKPATYICKPDSGAQGKGIFLLRNLKKLNPFVRLICQVYIPRPLLIDGYKFDLRIYILITSCDPLRIYVYNEGLARFATVKYNLPDDENISIAFMHLTNYSLNKFSQSYNPDCEGSKRKMSAVFNCLLDAGYDVQSLLDSIDSVIVKTMIAAQPTLKQYYRASFPKPDRPSSCFEILGFDILIDSDLKASLLEVNHSPSFNLDLAVDSEIKEALLRDTFSIIHLGGENKRYSVTSTDFVYLMGQRLSRATKYQFEYESLHQGNYRLIYPTPRYHLYTKFFDQAKAPISFDAASTAKRKAEVDILNGSISNIMQEKEDDKSIKSQSGTFSSSLKRIPKNICPNLRSLPSEFARDHKSFKTIVSRYTAKPDNTVSKQPFLYI